VPVRLIEIISHLKRGNAYQVLRQLLKNKFVTHVQKKCNSISSHPINIDDGYKLTYLGYDYLALWVFLKRGTISEVIGKIGVGKESDIYKCKDSKGQPCVLKLARLGRQSFKTIKN